jgi:hypothetical protein
MGSSGLVYIETVAKAKWVSVKESLTGRALAAGIGLHEIYKLDGIETSGGIGTGPLHLVYLINDNGMREKYHPGWFDFHENEADGREKAQAAKAATAN